MVRLRQNATHHRPMSVRKNSPWRRQLEGALFFNFSIDLIFLELSYPNTAYFFKKLVVNQLAARFYPSPAILVKHQISLNILLSFFLIPSPNLTASPLRQPQRNLMMWDFPARIDGFDRHRKPVARTGAFSIHGLGRRPPDPRVLP